MEAHEKAWKNPKHRAQWGSTLKTYAYPHIGSLLVKDIDQEHILKVLEPIWATKTETAVRLRGRIESVLDWATVRKYRSGENPARWKGHLDKILPAPGKVAKVEHHEAVTLNDLGAFVRDLRQRDGIAARALEFLILTAARSGEVRGMTWGEVDLIANIWTIPGERMKAGVTHQVPLSGVTTNPEHLRLLDEAGIKLAIIDTPPAVTTMIEQVMAVADLILIPTRPSPHDLRAVGSTVEIAERAGKRMVFVVNGAAQRARITGEAAIALSQHGTVAPVTLYQRTDFASSMIDGRTVQELDPASKSAGEVAELWSYVDKQLRKA